MTGFLRRRPKIRTARLDLRPPRHADYRAWVSVRAASKDFLAPWEPDRNADPLSRLAFTNRVLWARRAIRRGSGLPLFLMRRSDNVLLGALTLDGIKHGSTRTASIGYWTGEPYARQGYMRESILAVLDYAFDTLALSRVEAACLPENVPSRRLLQSLGFEYEGIARAYLHIGGCWRDHLLFAALRKDRADGKVGDVVRHPS